MADLSTPRAQAIVLADDSVALGSGDQGAGYRGNASVARVVARWHDDVHEGAFSVCDQQPCDAVRRVDR